MSRILCGNRLVAQDGDVHSQLVRYDRLCIRFEILFGFGVNHVLHSIRIEVSP